MRVPFVLSVFSVALLCGLLFAVPHTYADSCSSSDENRLDDEYDDAKDEFDDAVEDEEVEDKLDEVKEELRRSGRRSASSAAVERELDDLEEVIEELEETGDELYEDFRDLADSSRYEDCGDEVAKLGKRLRSYIRGEIRDFEDEIEELRDRNDGSGGPRRSQIRAPKWPTAGEAEPKKSTAKKSVTRRSSSSATSSSSGSSDREVTQPGGERTVAEIQAEMRRVFNQLRQLIAELRRAQQRTGS